MQFNIIFGDALTIRLEKKFDTVVCGDLIEHVTNPGALLDTISYHMDDDGTGLITTPNPFAINRFFNIFFDGWTPINQEHTCWFCPQTIYQIVDRSNLYIDDFFWLKTEYLMLTQKPVIGTIVNNFGYQISKRRKIFHNDFGIVLKKRA